MLFRYTVCNYAVCDDAVRCVLWSLIGLDGFNSRFYCVDFSFDQFLARNGDSGSVNVCNKKQTLIRHVVTKINNV